MVGPQGLEPEGSTLLNLIKYSSRFDIMGIIINSYSYSVLATICTLRLIYAILS